MPLNEANRAQRERYPLKFDLEGVPLAEREFRKEEMMNTHPVANNFAANYQQGGSVIDINNPPNPYAEPGNPSKRYAHQEFPKLVYPANWPAAKPVEVGSPEQEKKFLQKGFALKPPSHDNLPSAEDLDVVGQEKEITAKTRLKPGPKPKVQQEQAS